MSEHMSRDEIIDAIANGDMTADEGKALLKPATPSLSFKVSAKGAVSLYGLGRFPVTLYVNQWERVVAAIPKLTAFCNEHADELARK